MIRIQNDLAWLAKIEIQKNKTALEALLADRTTGRNIVWATDAYSVLGPEFARDHEITQASLTQENGVHLKTRACKKAEYQSERTKLRAEVFTPDWIVRNMCNELDDVWFDRSNVFFCDEKPTAHIEFDSAHKWQDYVKSTRLEITCGEGPFLVNRYDAVTGEEVENRVGLLDRKLRVIDENAKDEAEWLKFAVEAYKATYGYEFQGDSLLIARINLCMTFVEALQHTWQREPTPKELALLIDIITWNVFQMDGLTYNVPFVTKQGKPLQGLLFMQQATTTEPVPAQIKFWKKGQNPVLFRSLAEGGDNTMKFDYIIGNPPYQEEVAVKETENGQKACKSIFHNFQKCVDTIAKESSTLIYPAIRWMHRSGKGMNEFGKEQMNSNALSRLIVYKDAKDVFPKNSDIADGISIVTKRFLKQKFEYIYIYIYIMARNFRSKLRKNLVMNCFQSIHVIWAF